MIIKLVSTVLTITVLICSLSVFPGILASEDDPISVAPEDKPYLSEGVYIICEEKERRGEFEKHFITSDGKFIAVTYPEAVHYIDSEGNFADIDSTLKSGDGMLSSHNGDYSVFFPEKLNDGSSLSVKNKDDTFSWCISAKDKDGNVFGYSGSIAEIIENKTEQCEIPYIDDPSSFELPDLTTAVEYKNVFEGIEGADARYTLSYNKTEEDIIFNTKNNISALAITVNTELEASVSENGSVDFLNADVEKVFGIGVPYMYDSKDGICSSIKVTADSSDGKCIVTYELDSEWLNSEEREYPVVFDPSITTREYSSNLADTYVYQGTTNDHSSEARIYVGVHSGKIYRTYIKLNNLPDIDPLCPVLSANLSLKLYTTTTTGKQVSLYKVNNSWDPSTITYANQPALANDTFISSCDFDASTLRYTLNITSDFTALYDEYLSASNNGYMIKYTDESNNNPDWNSLYSMEYTSKTSYRPLITVVYGYSLPEELQDGGIYSFQNWGSYSLMTVHNGLNTSGTNVYQLSSGGPESASVSQKFKLDYIPSYNAYCLRAMCSSNGTDKVLDIAKTNGFVENNCNVQIYTSNDVLAQHWLIIPVDMTAFKIVPRTNMSLALTAYGDGDGSAGGTTSTSTGNLFVSEYTGSDYQKWFIYDCVNDTGVSAGRGILTNDTYYINNLFTGRFLRKNIYTMPSFASGLVSELGNTIRWKITLQGDNQYTIQSADNLSLFLGRSGTMACLVDCSNLESIPSSCVWHLETSVGGMYLSCVINSTTYYLKDDGNYLTLVQSRGTAGTEGYNRTVWRMASISYYTELTENASFDQKYFEVGNSVTPSLTAGGATWSNSSDFNYSVNILSCYNGSITADNGAHTLLGTVAGAVSIKATHKVTGRTFNFSVEVRAPLEKTADYLLPESIKEELYLIRTSIAQIQASDANATNKVASIAALEREEDVIRADYILTGTNHTSDYASQVIPNFQYILDNCIDTVSEDLYRVVANRFLVLYGAETSEGENNTNAYFLDYDCPYNLWTIESQSALNWFYSATVDGGDLLNRSGSGVQPVNRTYSKLCNLRLGTSRHDDVKNFCADLFGAEMEIYIKYDDTNNNTHYRGRADIVSREGEIWEVKPNNPVQHTNGVNQLKGYVINANRGQVYLNVDPGTIFGAGVAIQQFYLQHTNSFSQQLEILTVSPSQLAYVKPYESGLILYEPYYGPQPELVYEYSPAGVELLRKNIQFAVEPMVKVGAEDLVYAFATVVIEGVAIGVCIMSAMGMAPLVGDALAGVSGSIDAVAEAICNGTITVVSFAAQVIDEIIYKVSGVTG